MSPRLACLILLLAASPALSQPMGPPSDGRGDSEGPGRPRQQLFISPAGEPYRAPPGAPYPEADWFARSDADHDGALDLDEFTADALSFFDRLDVNHDRVVDGFENSDYEKKVAPEILGMAGGPGEEGPMAGGGRGGGPGGGPGGPPPGGRRGGGGGMGGPPGAPGPGGRGSQTPRRQGAAQYSLLNEPQPVRGADANLDQRVSRAEAASAAKGRWVRLDRDADGRLTLAELPKTPEQLAAGRGGVDPRRRSKPSPAKRRPLSPLKSGAGDTPVAADSGPGTS